MINTCKSKKGIVKYITAKKRHSILLHSEEMPVSNSADQVDSNINNTIEKEILSEAYLQIIPVTMTNSRRGY